MDKRTSLRINNRTETTFGIASVILSVLSLLMFLTAVYQSAYHLEGREITVGVIELIAILLCLAGFVFGIIGETRVNKFRRTAHAGIIANVIIGVLHVIVLIQAY